MCIFIALQMRLFWKVGADTFVIDSAMEWLPCERSLHAEKGCRRKALPIPIPNPEYTVVIHVISETQH
jgi:hypothetical protein